VNNLAKAIKVFGAALDPNDDPIKILAKCSYINRLAQNLVDIDKEILDPYDGLLNFSQVLIQEKYTKIGKFPVESWLTPKPKIEDYSLLDPYKYQNFTNSGSVAEYSIKMEGFIRDNILPDIPLMIGVDHSLTGGVLGALAEQYGRENILVVIFDAHFDGIPAKISLNLAKYAKENEEKINALFPQQLDSTELEAINLKDSYTCASYLNYLIKDDIISPENLIIFGCQDYPNDAMKSEGDERVKDFVDNYLGFEKKGVKFIPSSEDKEQMILDLGETLAKFNTPYLYISLDVDVCMFKEVLAARFMNAIGIEKDVLLKAALKIKDYMDTKNCALIGLDLMEIETYMLNRELKKSGERDRTTEVVDDFLNIITS
jgi:arginase family enzyme